MKKIKNFNIKLRKKEILHNLKLNGQVEEITPEIEELVVKEIERSKEYIHSASIFDTFNLESFENNFKLEMQMEQDSPPVAVSVMVVTIGSEIDKEFEYVGQKNDNLISKIIHNVGLEACDSSLNFVCKIIADEATEEDCRVITPEKVFGEQRKNIVVNFDTNKINVFLDNKGELHPAYTDIAILKWFPASKKR